jgi:hypothetical protein
MVVMTIRKRLLFLAILIIMAGWSALFQLIPRVHASSGTPVTVTSNTSLSFHMEERYIIQVGGYWFDFYQRSNDSYLAYNSSSDGSTWSLGYTASDAALAQAGTADFTACTNGSLIVIAYLTGSYSTSSNPATVKSRNGTQSGGVITWNTQVTVLASIHGYSRMSMVNTTNYWDLTFTNYGVPYTIYVYNSTDTTSWTQSLSTTMSGTGGYQPSVCLSSWSFQNTNGVVLIVGQYSDNVYRYQTFTGGSWGTAGTFGSKSYSVYPEAGALEANSAVHCTYLPTRSIDGGGVMSYQNYTTSWSATVTVDSGTCLYPSLTASPDALYVYYEKSTTIYYQNYGYSNYTWNGATSWITGETSPAFVNAVAYPTNTNTGVDWRAGASSPYNVRFAYASAALSDTTPPTYSSISTNTTLRGALCGFGIIWTDETGLSGYIFGGNWSGAWVNDTWAAFSTNPQTINKTQTLSNGNDNDTYEWWANDTSNNWNNTGVLGLTVTPYSESDVFTSAPSMSSSSLSNYGLGFPVSSSATFSSSSSSNYAFSQAFLGSLSSSSLLGSNYAFSMGFTSQTSSSSSASSSYSMIGILSSSPQASSDLQTGYAFNVLCQSQPALNALLSSNYEFGVTCTSNPTLSSSLLPNYALSILLSSLSKETSDLSSNYEFTLAFPSQGCFISSSLSNYEFEAILISPVNLSSSSESNSAFNLVGLSSSAVSSMLQGNYAFSILFNSASGFSSLLQDNYGLQAILVSNPVLNSSSSSNVVYREIFSSVMWAVSLGVTGQELMITLSSNPVFSSTANIPLKLIIFTINGNGTLMVNWVYVSNGEAYVYNPGETYDLAAFPVMNKTVFTDYLFNNVSYPYNPFAFLPNASGIVIVNFAPIVIPPPIPVPPPGISVPISPSIGVYALAVHVTDLFNWNAGGLTVVIKDVNGQVVTQSTTSSDGLTEPVTLPAGTYTIDIYQNNVFQLEKSLSLTASTIVQMQVGIPVAISWAEIILIAILILTIFFIVIIVAVRRRTR